MPQVTHSEVRPAQRSVAPTGSSRALFFLMGELSFPEQRSASAPPA